MSVPDRWWQKVTVRGSDECWEWLASTDRDGYGRFSYPTPDGQRHLRAHCYGYELLIGSRNGLCVCHACDNPSCCNPAHWFLGTPLQNNDDKVAKGRQAKLWGVPLNRSRQTHCKRGHPLEGDNLRIINGYRRCRACEPINSRIHYRRTHGLPGEGQPRPRREVTGGARSI